MKKLLYQAMVTIVAYLLMIATGTVYAFPSQNSACSQCHNDGAGSLTPSPDPLNVLIGGSGLLSFNVASLPDPNGNAMIALEGLTVAGLDATIGVGGDNWSLDAGAVADIKSDQGISTGAYNLDLGIGLSALLGTYNLTWYLAGEGPAGTSGAFTVNVIPEPATLALLGLSLAGMVVLARQNRRKREHWQKE